MKRWLIYVLSASTVWGGTILAVFAHPDDESVVAPLLAKYAAEGHTVHLVTLTAGDKGVQPHANIPAGPPLAAVRAKELACSVQALRLSGHTLGDFSDQGFCIGWDAQPMNKAADLVRKVIDEVRPEVVITWGPDGGTGHQDHRAASNITTQAFQQRGLLKHHPKKLYYVAFPEQPGEDSFASGRQISMEFVTTEIDGSKYLKQAADSIRCHKSQWTEDRMAANIRRWEERKGRVYLRLAMSSLGMPAKKEKDVFEGVRRGK